MLRKLKELIAHKIRAISSEQAQIEIAALLDGERERILAVIGTDAVASLLADTLKRTVSTWGDPRRIHVSKSALLNNATLNANSGDITIGDHSFCGHNVSIITGTHPIDATGKDRHEFPKTGHDIIIGKGVWIATNAVVLGPCTIGDGAVIAAGAIVRGGEIPPGSVYGGVPARFLRMVNEVNHA